MVNPSDQTISIIRQTRQVIVVNKPNGLATQAPSGIDSLEFRVKRFLDGQRDDRQQSTDGKAVYLGVPHRLDRPASGVIIFASDKPAARFLAEQFRERRVGKTYWALVTGHVDPKRGTWEDWMRKVPGEARSEICSPDFGGAQIARLHYQVLAETGAGALASCLLEIDLDTGRSHQIRVQAGSRQHPIVGDELYGSQEWFGPRVDDVRRRAIALHARHLEVADPAGGDTLSLVAPLGQDWPDWCRQPDLESRS